MTARSPPPPPPYERGKRPKLKLVGNVVPLRAAKRRRARTDRDLPEPDAAQALRMEITEVLVEPLGDGEERQAAEQPEQRLRTPVRGVAERDRGGGRAQEQQELPCEQETASLGHHTRSRTQVRRTLGRNPGSSARCSTNAVPSPLGVQLGIIIPLGV